MITLGVTIGDPAGIGPEVALKAASHPWVRKNCRLVIFGGSNISLKKLPRSTQLINPCPYSLRAIKMGEPSALAGRASGDFIKEAVSWAKSKKIDALVTAPINKHSFLMGGWGEKYIGHTEMLGKLTKTKEFALMMVYGSVRAVHVTSHVPLRKVSSSLTRQKIKSTILLAYKWLRDYGIRHPRIAVCGLNPHAGDDGILGNEENKLIAPAIKALKKKKMRVSGPFAADVVWPFVKARDYDVGIAMYHDQGQIPIKLLGFGSTRKGRKIVHGVNVTLGLPIIRTSADHGSAYDIAGKGVASPDSMVDAMKLAWTLAKRKKK